MLALQDQDAFLLEVIGKGLLLPSFYTDHLLFELVEGTLVTFECIFGQH